MIIRSGKKLKRERKKENRGEGGRRKKSDIEDIKKENRMKRVKTLRDLRVRFHYRFPPIGTGTRAERHLPDSKLLVRAALFKPDCVFR